MKVWVVYTDAGMGRLGVFGVARDGGHIAKLRDAGTYLRQAYGVEGRFTKVTSPEAHYRPDELVYRNGWLTVVARPFHLPDEEAG